MNNQKTTMSKMGNIKWYFSFFVLSSIMLLIAACTEFVKDEDMSNDIELLSNSLSLKHGKIGISDAANDGIDEFYFMAPTVGKTPKFNGTFHPNLQPVVEISDDLDFKNVLVTFTRKGTGSNVISVNESEEFYSATWNTSDFKPVLGKIYRIRVKVGFRALGFVDVAIVPAKSKPLNSDVIPVVQNQSFRIDFRIEDKICPARIEILPEEATILIDGEQQFTAKVFNFYDEELENQKIKWSVGNPSLASINQNGLAKGLQFGFTPINAQVEDVIGTASLFIQEVDAPRPGRDVVVFNDNNPFDNIRLQNPNNQTLVKNLLNFSAPGIRNEGNKVWFDCGRNSRASVPTPCQAGRFSPFRDLIQSLGFSIENVFSSSGAIIDIPVDVKVIFLWLPTVPYTVNEINIFKKFAEEGGRIVFVGEWDGFYTQAGLNTENQFLINMGAFMRNVGSAVDCGDITIPGTSLRPHPITRDMTNVQVACASVIELGPDDFALFYDTSNRFVLAGVAQIDTTPITELKSLRLNDSHGLRLLDELNPKLDTGF